MKTIIECKRVEIEKDDERRFKTIRIVRVDNINETIEISFARLKGEWTYIDGVPCCPFCKKIAHFNDYEGFELSNFCRDCGADMRVEGV